MIEPEIKLYVITDGDDNTRIIEGKTDQDIHEEIELYLEDYSPDFERLSVFEVGKGMLIGTHYTLVDEE